MSIRPAARGAVGNSPALHTPKQVEVLLHGTAPVGSSARSLRVPRYSRIFSRQRTEHSFAWRIDREHSRRAGGSSRNHGKVFPPQSKPSHWTSLRMDLLEFDISLQGLVSSKRRWHFPL